MHPVFTSQYEFLEYSFRNIIVDFQTSVAAISPQRDFVVQRLRTRFPEHKKATVIAERFENHGESYFLFIDDPSLIGPTNNVAEHEIRTLIMDRMVTQGVHSDMGNEWHERFWTTVATCRRQGRNVMAFLQDAIFSFMHVLPPPSLLPVPAAK